MIGHLPKPLSQYQRKKPKNNASHAPHHKVQNSLMSNTDNNKDGAKPYLASAGQEISEFAKTAIFAVLLALIIRTFFFEPFNIPSGSMKPTLLVGDYLFVSKPAYGYSRYSFPFALAPIEGRIGGKAPLRGDVIVFKLPTNTSVDYIKRIVALPGETVQVREGRLYINGKKVQREEKGYVDVDSDYGAPIRMMEYLETLPGGVQHSIYEEDDDMPLDNTPIYVVPEGHYFAMGDNRDHSQDSRVTQLVGPIPLENIVGRADFLFFSTNGTGSLLKPWTWPSTMRTERFTHSTTNLYLCAP